MMRRMQAFGLILPLLAFLGVFFLWPLASVLGTAVSDTEVSRAFPNLGDVMGDWDGTAPTPAMNDALVADLRETSQTDMGNAVRRLNSQTSGFRSLMGRTQQAVRGDRPVTLTDVDDRWADPIYWQTIRSALPPLTDRFLLSAVDRGRGEDGMVQRLPQGQSVHVQIFLRTLGISALVTVICALVGLPYAMLMAQAKGTMRHVLMASVLLPMWTSILVRCTAWFIVLQNDGVASQAARVFTGMQATIPLLFTRTGVIIAMTHVMLPFMILSIYAVLIAIPRNLVPAAASMGAGPISAFRLVLLPLVMPGIVSGGLLVFMTSLGFYILPALLGGGNDQLISAFVAQYAIQQANWPLASALGVVLLVLTVVIFGLYQRLTMRGARGEQHGRG